MENTPLIELKSISKFFGKVIALKDVSLEVRKGEVMCLLGDNGAGKSTLIKCLSGVHQPNEGSIYVEGAETVFESPRDPLDMGIATVYQDLGLVPLMSITRNFFMGREPTKYPWPFTIFDEEKAQQIATDKMLEIGIDIRDTGKAVGTRPGHPERRVVDRL